MKNLSKEWAKDKIKKIGFITIFALGIFGVTSNNANSVNAQSVQPPAGVEFSAFRGGTVAVTMPQDITFDEKIQLEKEIEMYLNSITDEQLSRSTDEMDIKTLAFIRETNPEDYEQRLAELRQDDPQKYDRIMNSIN
ncbi:hypothetical protein LJC56_06375 [Christensenellaceae bacterium OttesenSCG-928-K19]|nr:hypothetical protein [Christensenellaceae bacterium OttesenSCG-928-K19]